jgi:hypothetical protein
VPKILTRLVLRDAHLPSVQALPTALPFLATPDAVRRNAPQLRHVTHWAVMSLADTLALLAPAVGAHEAVAAYTRRALDSHPPDTVAFFLPQLVQVRESVCLYFDPSTEYLAGVSEPNFTPNATGEEVGVGATLRRDRPRGGVPGERRAPRAAVRAPADLDSVWRGGAAARPGRARQALGLQGPVAAGATTRCSEALQ